MHPPCLYALCRLDFQFFRRAGVRSVDSFLLFLAPLVRLDCLRRAVRSFDSLPPSAPLVRLDANSLWDWDPLGYRGLLFLDGNRGVLDDVDEGNDERQDKSKTSNDASDNRAQAH